MPGSFTADLFYTDVDSVKGGTTTPPHSVLIPFIRGAELGKKTRHSCLEYILRDNNYSSSGWRSCSDKVMAC